MTAYNKAVGEELSSRCPVPASIPLVGSCEQGRLHVFTVLVQVLVILLLISLGTVGKQHLGDVLKYCNTLTLGCRAEESEPRSM